MRPFERIEALDQPLARRTLFKSLAGIAAAAAVPVPAFAAMGLNGRNEVRLAVRNVHTNERFDALVVRAGCLDRQGLAELNHAMRDWRTGETRYMDPALLLLAASIRDRLGVDKRRPFELICGYRSARTNARRHAQSSGVAKNSQHVTGKAIDIALPGTQLSRLRDAAFDARAGGVGYYPGDGFVHIDTAAVRRWAG